MIRIGNFDQKKEPILIRWWVLVLFILGTIGVLFLIVCWVTSPASSSRWDFSTSKTGSIGDTIGGITNPIIGLIGAILVYISFREQLRANYQQRKALEKEKEIRREDKKWESINILFSELKTEVNSFATYKSVNGHQVQVVGVEGLLNFAEIRPVAGEFSGRKRAIYFQTLLIVTSMGYLLDLVKDYDKDDPSQSSLVFSIVTYYQAKLEYPFGIILRNGKPNFQTGGLLKPINHISQIVEGLTKKNHNKKPN